MTGPDAEPVVDPGGQTELWLPREIDLTVPNVARCYDVFLDGKDNYRADRELAARVLQRFPAAHVAARANRDFVTRVVGHLCRAGVTQFIDIGSGLPTKDNVHEIAQRCDPQARVLYVDHDPVVVRYAQALLSGVERRGAHRTVGAIEADVRDPDAILADPVTGELIDFDRPVALLMGAVLHFVSDRDDPVAVVARLAECVTPGSYLAISHAGGDAVPEGARQAAAEYRAASTSLTLRGTDRIRELFGDFVLVPPGLVPLTQWPEGTPPAGADPVAEVLQAGLGHKPDPATPSP